MMLILCPKCQQTVKCNKTFPTTHPNENGQPESERARDQEEEGQGTTLDVVGDVS
jgi:hypothetical protein